MKQYLFVTLLTFVGYASHGQGPTVVNEPANKVPQEFVGAGITEKMGSQVDPTLEFKDDQGSVVQVGKYFDGKRPVFVAPVYYGCPNLCNFFLNGVLDTLRAFEWEPGNQFTFLAVSMDHTETPTLAQAKKENYIKEYGRPHTKDGWHFLTGSEENVRKFMDQIGFGFKWDEESQQYAHAAAGIILTPGGFVSRYLYGIQFDVKTLRWSLVEASQNQIGTLMDRVMLFCFKFDPHQRKYSFYLFNVMRAAAALTLLGLAIYLIPHWRRNMKAHSKGDSSV